MNAIVTHVDFLWDNYQGGSGSYHTFKVIVNIPDTLPSCNIISYVQNKVNERSINSRVFRQDNKPTIISIEIVI